MSSEKERRILERIRESGYPLEVEVVNQLLRERWAVQPQYSYVDKRTGKIRPIDILVTCFLPVMKFHEMPRMAIECKKSENAWVFYCTDSVFRNPAELGKAGISLLDIAALGTTSASLFTPFLEYNILEGEYEFPESVDLSSMLQEISKIHFFDPCLPRAFVGHVVKEKMRKDAPDSLQRALHELRGACLNLINAFPKSPILATIVVKGQLYVYRKTDEKEELEPTDHVLYSTLGFLSDDFEPGKSSFPPTIVDIITDSHLPDYITLIKNDFETLTKMYGKIKQTRE